MPGRSSANAEGLLTATSGRGPLLQRDYWAVFAADDLDPRDGDPRDLGPRDVARCVAERFVELAPPELVRFRRRGDRAAPLEVDDEMDGEIRGSGPFRVRVAHRDDNSLTLATMAGHPEAGRITFGSYRNVDGDVVFHVRSRARSASTVQRLGFVAVGEAMQTDVWCGFVDRLAAMLDVRIDGFVHAELRRVPERDADRGGRGEPTYVAEGS